MGAEIRFSDFTYSPRYQAREMNGIEDPRPWDLQQEILEKIQPNGILADIGCGPALKIIPLSPHFQGIIGIDVRQEVLENALTNVREAQIENIVLVQKDKLAPLPLADESIDMVTCMLAPHDALEAYRILKPGGYLIMERVGERDKENIKRLFGKDAKGPRGYRSEMEPGAIVKLHQEDLTAAKFINITCIDGFWKTWYTPDGLRMLLDETPTVRDYDEGQDASIVEKVISELTTDKGIETHQHRVLVIARKPL